MAIPITIKIPDVTAIVGACTGTAGLVLSIINTYIQRRQNSIDIRVSADIGLITEGPISSQTLLVLAAANHGGKPVVLSSFGIVLPGPKTMYPQGTPLNGKSFPCPLAPGEKIEIPLGIQMLAINMYRHEYRGTIHIRAFYQDQLGRVHRMRKPYRFEVEAWAKHEG